MFLNSVDQLSRDDEQVQAASHVHQKCCHQELLREVHQLHSGLHLYLQTGVDRLFDMHMFWGLEALSVFSVFCACLKSTSHVIRWTCYRNSMKPHWRLWRMQKMTDCGSKLTQRYTKIFHWFQIVLNNSLVKQMFRLYFLIQLGKLYLEREEYGKLQKILRQLHQSCQVICSVNLCFCRKWNMCLWFYHNSVL